MLILSDLCILFSWENQSAGFFDLLGVQREKVISVQLLYGQAEIPLSENEQIRLLESLDQAQRQPEKEESQGYRPSEFTVQINTEQKAYDLKFYWFSGKRYEDNRFAAYTDRRFDVEIGGKYYSFLQQDTAYWNEDLSRQAFQGAVMRGEAQEQYVLDGYDGKVIAHDMGVPEGAQDMNISCESVFAESDIVMIGHFTGNYQLEDTGHKNPVFQVEEVWKSECDPGSEIALREWPYGENTHEGKTYMHYPPIELPSFIENERYLLCLQDTAEGYRLTKGVCGSARIWKQSTYPRYNTEFHPFFSKSLEELRKGL